MERVRHDLFYTRDRQPATGRQRQVFSVIGGDNVKDIPGIPARLAIHVVTPFFYLVVCWQAFGLFGDIRREYYR
jgi:hypothetical protein